MGFRLFFCRIFGCIALCAGSVLFVEISTLRGWDRSGAVAAQYYRDFGKLVSLWHHELRSADSSMGPLVLLDLSSFADASVCRKLRISGRRRLSAVQAKVPAGGFRAERELPDRAGVLSADSVWHVDAVQPGRCEVHLRNTAETRRDQ